eukprot:643116-Prorocentrum_minimum.AAC.1
MSAGDISAEGIMSPSRYYYVCWRCRNVTYRNAGTASSMCRSSPTLRSACPSVAPTQARVSGARSALAALGGQEG